METRPRGLGYIEGRSVIQMIAGLVVTRGAVNGWRQRYEASEIAGLETGRAPGRIPRLTEKQRHELGEIIANSSLASGFGIGVWTGFMTGSLIAARFGVKYHDHHIPRLLHELLFFLQRPRKRLAKADKKGQKEWIRTRFAAIRKKRVGLVG